MGVPRAGGGRGSGKRALDFVRRKSVVNGKAGGRRLSRGLAWPPVGGSYK